MKQEEISIQVNDLNLSVESFLVLALAQTSPDATHIKAIENLLRRISNWRYVYRFARKQGVLSLLVNNLDRTFPGTVPKSVFTDVQKYTTRNLYLLIRLREITSLFATHGLRAIPYKGPTLSAIVYKNQSLRISSDLDFLVHPKDYKETKSLLLSHGYQLQMDCGYKHHFWHPRKQIDLDVHRNLAPRWSGFELNFDHAWKECIEHAIPLGGSLRTFCFEHLLIVLCIDLMKDIATHYKPRLIKVADIAELTTHTTSLDWDRIIHEINNLGLRRVVCFGLLLAVRLYSITLPPNVRQEIQLLPLVRPLSDLAIKMILDDNDFQPDVTPRTLHELKTYLTLHDSVKNKIKLQCYYLVSLARVVLRVPVRRHRQAATQTFERPP
jgi:hypothetical protein